jgi:hypothetical protein
MSGMPFQPSANNAAKARQNATERSTLSWPTQVGKDQAFYLIWSFIFYEEKSFCSYVPWGLHHKTFYVRN